MSFITQIQASLQGCVIDTPHSLDIRAIVGTALCASDVPVLLCWMTEAGASWLTESGPCWQTEAAA